MLSNGSFRATAEPLSSDAMYSATADALHTITPAAAGILLISTAGEVGADPSTNGLLWGLLASLSGLTGVLGGSGGSGRRA